MIARKGIFGVLKRLFLFVFITALVIVPAILAKNNAPTQYLSGDFDFSTAYHPPELNATQWNILLDQHSHTELSDGVLTPEQNVLWHIAGGYNACVITDHGTIDNAVAARTIARQKFNNTIKVLIGEEWSTHRFHMNLLNLTSAVPILTDDPTDGQIQDAIDAAHAQGGIVVVDHVPWMKERTSSFPTLDELVAWGVDYIEVLNGGDFDLESYEYCKDHALGIISGTDMHSPGKVYGWTTLNVTEFTEEAILGELLARRTGIIYNFTGIDPAQIAGMVENPEFTILEPLIYLGRMFQVYDLGNDQYDWVGIAVVGGYLFGAFAISEFIRFGYRKLKSQHGVNPNAPPSK